MSLHINPDPSIPVLSSTSIIFLPHSNALEFPFLLIGILVTLKADRYITRSDTQTAEQRGPFIILNVVLPPNRFAGFETTAHSTSMRNQSPSFIDQISNQLLRDIALI